MFFWFLLTTVGTWARAVLWTVNYHGQCSSIHSWWCHAGGHASTCQHLGHVTRHMPHERQDPMPPFTGRTAPHTYPPAHTHTHTPYTPHPTPPLCSGACALSCIPYCSSYCYLYKILMAFMPSTMVLCFGAVIHAPPSTSIHACALYTLTACIPACLIRHSMGLATTCQRTPGSWRRFHFYHLRTPHLLELHAHALRLHAHTTRCHLPISSFSPGTRTG